MKYARGFDVFCDDIINVIDISYRKAIKIALYEVFT